MRIKPFIGLIPVMAVGALLYIIPWSNLGRYLAQESDERPAWIPAAGERLSVQAYPELYAVIGTTFGGDGKTYFKAPIYLSIDQFANQRFGMRTAIRCVSARPLEDGTAAGELAWCSRDDLGLER